MGHVAALIGGVHVDLKTRDQAGAVYRGRAEGAAEGGARVPERPRLRHAGLAAAGARSRR